MGLESFRVGLASPEVALALLAVRGALRPACPPDAGSRAGGQKPPWGRCAFP